MVAGLSGLHGVAAVSPAVWAYRDVTEAAPSHTQDLTAIRVLGIIEMTGRALTALVLVFLFKLMNFFKFNIKLLKIFICRLRFP